MNIYAVRTSEKWLDLYKSNLPPKVTVTTITRKVDAYETYTIKAIKATGKYWYTVPYHRFGGLCVKVGAYKRVPTRLVNSLKEDHP